MMELPEENRTLMATEIILARLLRIGSIIAAILISAGIAAMLLANASFAPGLITSGLLVLLLTPIMRVFVAAVVFARERDWLFALFCLVVLCSLITGALLGRVE